MCFRQHNFVSIARLNQNIQNALEVHESVIDLIFSVFLGLINGHFEFLVQGGIWILCFPEFAVGIIFVLPLSPSFYTAGASEQYILSFEQQTPSSFQVSQSQCWELLVQVPLHSNTSFHAG